MYICMYDPHQYTVVHKFLFDVLIYDAVNIHIEFVFLCIFRYKYKSCTFLGLDV